MTSSSIHEEDVATMTTTTVEQIELMMTEQKVAEVEKTIEEEESIDNTIETTVSSMSSR
jgi:hypothetical protein